jgi:acetolactate synthase-1/2/3 large subunit
VIAQNPDKFFKKHFAFPPRRLPIKEGLLKSSSFLFSTSGVFWQFFLIDPMASPSKPKPSTSHAASAQGRRIVMNGAEILVASLEREGVEYVFAYPGGCSMPIHQALTKSQKIRTILPRHEQGGGFAAEGYARVTGKAGVCMATSGPGATNLVTCIADAYMDSIPLVAITGQVAQEMIGRGAFQETDFFGMTLPVVKHSYLVMDINDIPRIIKEAFTIAQSGRPGPVLIDLPKNIQMQTALPIFPQSVSLPGYHPICFADDALLQKVFALIAEAKRPMIYCGGGVISAEASKELLEFAERSQIPVASTLMGIGCFPEDHELSLKWLGMHGTVYANNAVNEADLLLAIGVRFDDRVTGKVEKFCEHGTIVHIDIDHSEINKNRVVKYPILGDVKDALSRLNKKLDRAGEKPQKRKYTRFPAWYQQIAAWKKAHPLSYKDTPDAIQPQYVIELLMELTKGKAIITTGVGQHQMWAAQFYNFTEPRTLLTSAGLGSMGFGYPAALGAKLGRPDKQVIDIDGDGSFLMNVQELATAHIDGIAAKVIILNNQHLGMVMQWEDRFYDSNRGHTFLGDPKDRNRIYPDYLGICQGFGVPAERVIHKKDLRAALQRMLDAQETYVLDVMTPYTEHVLPMIPTGKTYKDIITE